MNHEVIDWTFHVVSNKQYLTVENRLEAYCVTCKKLLTGKLSMTDEFLMQCAKEDIEYALRLFAIRVADGHTDNITPALSQITAMSGYGFVGKPLDGWLGTEEYKETSAARELSDLSTKLPGVNYRINDICELQTDSITGGLEKCSFHCPTVRDRIMHLNDFHKWTREQVADWLDEISDPTGVNGPNINF